MAAHLQPIRAVIEGIGFTLSYDYDQLRDGLLSGLSQEGKVIWFSQRMDYVFIEPMRRLYGGKTAAFNALNSKGADDLPARSFVVATFSVLLNGIEMLGSFLPEAVGKERDPDRNWLNFRTFIANYMKAWDKSLAESADFPLRDIKRILWDYHRNAIAHGFRIREGGIDNEVDDDGTRWRFRRGAFHVGPYTFFRDFEAGVKGFFLDVKEKPDRQNVFLRRFEALYPCGPFVRP